MTDTNGHVAPGHLILFGGIPVSKLIYATLAAASLDFHRQGYTFSAASPLGGFRPFDVQGAVQAAFDAKNWGPPYYLNPKSSSRPANAGHSRHGFGLAVDVVTNAPAAKRDQILAEHGFHLWSTSDPNHFEPDGIDVLAAPPDSAFAALDQSQLNNSTPMEDDMSTATAYKINSGGLAGVSVVMSTDRTYVVPAAEVNPADQWAAPILNVGAHGAVPVPVAQDHLEYLLHTLGYKDGDLVRLASPPAGQLGGGFMFPVQPGSGSSPIDIAALAKQIAALIPAPDLSAVTSELGALDAALARGLTITGTATPAK
jgi:hypothetical protein